MTTTCLPTCVRLSETATHPIRRAFWAPKAEGADVLGTLTIVQQKGHGSGCKAEVSHYAVEHVRQGDASLGYYLLNQTSGEIYHVRPAGVVPTVMVGCTCRAGLVGRHECKHVAALASLAAAGVL
jgi:hypothetical protein